MSNSRLLEHKRVGLYHVGDMVFISKSDALIYATATKQPVYWDFNDDVFSKIDWKIPISTPLSELYKQRAQQLRDKYDYLSLFFSGGVDSANVLHSFIDNGIFLDEIVMYRPVRTIKNANTLDKSPKNVYSEIEFAAIPHLKKYLKDERTLVRFIDMDTSAEEFFNDDNLLSEFCTLNNMGVTPVVKTAMCLTDKIWNALYESGKTVAHIHGIDKPIISIDNGEYSFQFEDSMSFNFESKSLIDQYDRINKHQYHEYFYWTPEYPHIVVNQAHELIRYFQQHVEEFKNLEEHLRTNKYAIHRSMSLDRAVNISCYPTWDNCFQTDKFFYTFASNQFNKLLIPFIRTEQFAKTYYHRYFNDANIIDPKLIFHPVYKNRSKVCYKYYPVMSLQKFYQGVVRNV